MIRQAGTSAEGAIANRYDTVRNRQFRQSRAPVKRIVAERDEAVAQRRADQIRTTGKTISANPVEGVRKDYFGQPGATRKSKVTETGQPIWKADPAQIGAVVESIAGDAGDAIRDDVRA